MIDWTTCTEEDVMLIRDIVKRAVKFMPRLDTMSVSMDLQACHTCGNPLKLAELLAASDGDLAHDVSGINRHLDRETGKLGGCFSPRFSART